METVHITDNFQEYVKKSIPEINTYNLGADLTIFGLLAYTYYVGNAELYTKLIKYIVIFFVVRYLANVLTNYKMQPDSGKNYFQLNSHVAIFAIVILTNTVLDLTFYTTVSLLISYTMFVSAIGYGHTTDNCLTLLLVHNLICSASVY